MIDLRKICQEKGLRMTDQRSVIADIITELGSHPAGHPDVNLIYMKASEKDSNISIATVYRTVKLFEEYGVIEKHDFKDGRSRYEPIQESNHHDHLIDIESGDVYEFSNTEIEVIQKRIAEELGFELVDHRLELYGKKINK
jgi:Fur family ferric uptake transcriptional regulator